jgi:hypothetical protein
LWLVGDRACAIVCVRVAQGNGPQRPLQSPCSQTHPTHTYELVHTHHAHPSLLPSRPFTHHPRVQSCGMVWCIVAGQLRLVRSRVLSVRVSEFVMTCNPTFAFNLHTEGVTFPTHTTLSHTPPHSTSRASSVTLSHHSSVHVRVVELPTDRPRVWACRPVCVCV